MATIKFWFWDAAAAKKDGKPLTWVDRIIMLRSSLTHAEIQFVDRGGVSFSATMADGVDGCRFKYIGYSHPQRWKCLTFEVPETVEAAMWATACQMAGLWTTWQRDFDVAAGKIYRGITAVKYDLHGLLSFALRKSGKLWLDAVRGIVWCWTAPFKPSEHAVWCSEACALVWNSGWKQYFGYSDRVVNPTELSPEELYNKLKEKKAA